VTGPIAEVRSLLGRAEYLAAFDRADRALGEEPHNPRLQHLAALALARAGAPAMAAARLRDSGLLDWIDDHPPELAEDLLGLDARLVKDVALAAQDAERGPLIARAAQKYDDVFRRFDGTYSGINAATMWQLAGDRSRATEIARRVLDLLDSRPDDEWAAPTRAEGHLLLGDAAAAADALALADRSTMDVSDRATTRRQLHMVCAAVGIDPTVVEILRVPVPIHYCGHVPSTGRFTGEDERFVAASVRHFLAERGSVVAWGSLAAGADIVIAEQILAAGGELHIVLPFPEEEFVRTSVASAGNEWTHRFRGCLERALEVQHATTGRHGDDDSAYAYCSSIAMGSAILRGRALARPAEQLAAWDGSATGRIAGTAADVARWRATGLAATVLPVSGSATTTADDPHPPERAVFALLFADVKGYSALRDRDIRAFVAGVLHPLAAVLDRPSVRHRNTWGDAIYAVVDDVADAADIALGLQETIAAIDMDALGLPPLQLRIGAHAGPVVAVEDPVIGAAGFFGEHVTRAARIEPIAPPGGVYVTEAFAALLALDGGHEYACEYVGQVPTAKSFGTMRMHLLRR
jgi:class 3 adenylate cyclase